MLTSEDVSVRPAHQVILVVREGVWVTEEEDPRSEGHTGRRDHTGTLAQDPLPPTRDWALGETRREEKDGGRRKLLVTGTRDLRRWSDPGIHWEPCLTVRVLTGVVPGLEVRLLFRCKISTTSTDGSDRLR